LLVGDIGDPGIAELAVAHARQPRRIVTDLPRLVGGLMGQVSKRCTARPWTTSTASTVLPGAGLALISKAVARATIEALTAILRVGRVADVVWVTGKISSSI